MMTIHKLSARDGYTYLTRQVASADEQRAGQDLAGYYTATGTPPGRWTGAGAAHLGVRGEVTETQMRALFGTGLHPDADAIITALTAAGATPEPAVPTGGRQVVDPAENVRASGCSLGCRWLLQGLRRPDKSSPDKSARMSARCAGGLDRSGIKPVCGVHPVGTWRMTRTGQVAWVTTCWLTEPSSISVNSL